MKFSAVIGQQNRDAIGFPTRRHIIGCWAGDVDDTGDVAVDIDLDWFGREMKARLSEEF